jgi:hypothetical protein
MSTLRPPRLAVVLLNRLLPENEPLTGDLLEEFQRRRSRLWFWRQTIAAVVLSRRASRRLLTTVRLSDKPLPLRYDEIRLPIRLSASPFPIAGGLGIASLGVVVAMYRPGAWWFPIVAVAGGLVLGVLKVLRTRHRFRQDPQTFLLQHGTRPPAGPRG